MCSVLRAFLAIYSLNSHNKPMGKIYKQSHFINEETEGQKETEELSSLPKDHTAA